MPTFVLLTQGVPAYNNRVVIERESVERLLEEGRVPEGLAALAQGWHASPSLSAAEYVVSIFRAHAHQARLRAVRIAIARAVTVEPLVPALRAASYAWGLAPLIHVGEFNTFAQELLDPQSALYRHDPDIAILYTTTAAIAPDLWEPTDTSERALRDAADRAYALFEQLISAFRAKSTAHLLVHALDAPDFTRLGIYDRRAPFGQRAAIDSVNERLASLIRSIPSTHLVEYDDLIARYGRRAWFDPTRWERFRLPTTASNFVHVVDEWMRFIVPIMGGAAKLAVVDLDNTLWRGILGEDGFAGIKMSAEPPGSSYRAVQRALLALRERGIMLAVCSKNDAAAALEVLARHPDMLLRPTDFVATRINWQPKSENLRSMARELNIGIDAIAFIDDNPVERAEVNGTLPDLRVVALPDDAQGYARAILEHPAFQRIAGLSREDQERTRYYQEQRQRAASLRTMTKDEFLQSLEQRIEIRPLSETTRSRAAQLLQRTNQFNVTTKRHTEADLARMMQLPEWRIVTVSVADRFGDNGIVGVAITQDRGEDVILDSLLLSCRVIGRAVESALIAHLAAQARDRGQLRLIGTFIPTVKNEPASRFFAEHGFMQVARDDVSSTWELSLEPQHLRVPEWIVLKTEEEAAAT